MPKLEDLTGKRFGRLVVIDRAEGTLRKDGSYATYWNCKCDCGKIKRVRGSHLKDGSTISCGCFAKQNNSIKRTTHSGSKTKLYKAWGSMIRRCEDKKYKDYCRYGARGISICDEWHDFAKFRDWAFSNGYKEGLSIDRIDVNGNYCPENCRWADSATQANNRRTNVYITYNGETKTMKQWSDYFGINYSTMMERLRRGWSMERIAAEPVQVQFSRKRT